MNTLGVIYSHGTRMPGLRKISPFKTFEFVPAFGGSQPGSNVQAITSEVPCIPGVHSMACCQRPGPISHPRSAVILTEIHCLVGSSCYYKKEIVWAKRSDLCLYWEF